MAWPSNLQSVVRSIKKSDLQKLDVLDREAPNLSKEEKMMVRNAFLKQTPKHTAYIWG
jgi:aspartokinase-like uncharacterized kinase